MKAKSQRDLVAGLMFVLTGVAFAWGSTEYEFGNAANPGPGYFPFGLGVILAFLGGLVLFKAMTVETQDGEPIGSIGWRPLLVVVATILLFAVGLPRLGLPLAVALVCFVVSFAGRDCKWWEAALLAAGLAAFSAAVFVGGLGLNLPLKPAPLAAWGF
jgi:Tripartite tricarboxylate transporter TctB family